MTVRRPDDLGYRMLVTIREYGAQRLEGRLNGGRIGLGAGVFGQIDLRPLHGTPDVCERCIARAMRGIKP